MSTQLRINRSRLNQLAILSFLLLSIITRQSSAKASVLPPETRKTSQLNLSIVSGNTTDDAAVLQLCLDLPQIQQNYPKNTDGTYKQVFIMQYPVVFDANLAVSKFGQPILFRTRPVLYSEKADAFFIVKEFVITGNTATVTFRFNYNNLSIPAFADISLTLQKSGNTWSVVTTTINS